MNHTHNEACDVLAIVTVVCFATAAVVMVVGVWIGKYNRKRGIW